jgi:hypothetical protein
VSVSLIWDGLEELKAALRSLPFDLTGEAANDVEEAANAAAFAVKSAYGAHRVTGNLQDHVVVQEQARGQFGVAYVVKSTARHAWLFEHGTEARHYVTRRGVKHLTGKMPPAHIFIPTMMRQRRAMYGRLKDVLVRAGLQVSGEP